MGTGLGRGTVAGFVAVAAVGVMACGGGSEDSNGSAGSGPESVVSEPTDSPSNEDSGVGAPLAQVDVGGLDPDVVSVADAATDLLGDPAGAEAIVFALERGYDGEQLVVGVAGLAADGTISADSRAESPTRPRQGLVVLPEEAAAGGEDEESLGVEPVGLRRSPLGELGQVDIATLFASALENGGTPPAFAAAVVSLDRSGYSLEQIVAAVLAGEQIWTQDNLCARLGFTPVRPARVDTACAASVASLADVFDEIPDRDVEEVSPATSEAPAPAPADDVGFEPGTFVGSVVEQTSGADGEGEVLRDVIEFIAGDTLTGKVELLAYGPGPLDSDFECFYLLYEFDALPLVDADEARFAGAGTVSAGFSEGTCDGNPPIEETVPFDATAQVVGDTLTVTLTADGDEGTFTAARVAS